MVELTYEELKQSLMCCTVYKDCADCPLHMNNDHGTRADCTYYLMSAAMNCINTMERDFVNVSSIVRRWESVAVRCEREIFERR